MKKKMTSKKKKSSKVSSRRKKQDQEDPGLQSQDLMEAKIPSSLRLKKKIKKTMMNIQGLIWNCRGIKKKGVSTFLKNLILEYKFHFIGLQETMIADCNDSLLRKFDYNQDYLWKWNDSKGKSGRILVGIKY